MRRNTKNILSYFHILSKQVLSLVMIISFYSSPLYSLEIAPQNDIITESEIKSKIEKTDHHIKGKKSIKERLSKDHIPEIRKEKFFKKFGRIFSKFINIAGFFPIKLFEFTILSGGWELLSQDSKYKKIEDAILKGVLNDKALTKELAPGYKNCKKLDQDDLEDCEDYLKELKQIAKGFSQKSVHELKIMNLQAMQELEKEAHLLLLSKIASKNIKKNVFPAHAQMTKNDLDKLDQAIKSVVSNYKICLSSSNQAIEISDCDHKIGVSAPYLIGLEVFKFILNDNIRTEIPKDMYVTLNNKAQLQFNTCSELTYFRLLDSIEKNGGKNQKEDINSGNIIKACIFSGITEIIGDIAEYKVKKATHIKLNEIHSKNKPIFSGKVAIDQCLEKEKLLSFSYIKYDYNSLENLSPDEFKEKIETCSRVVTENIGKKLIIFILKNNPHITDTFHKEEQDQVILKIIQNGYTECLTTLKEKDPSLCAAAVELEATKEVVKKALYQSVLNEVNKNKRSAAKLVSSSHKTYSNCMQNLKIQIYKNLKNSSFKEEAVSECLKKSMLPLVHDLSGHIIRKELRENKSLKELNIKYSHKQIHGYQNFTKSCFKKLLRCEKKQILDLKNTPLQKINCISRDETLQEIQDKTETITNRCKNEIYKTIIPSIVKKVITTEINANITNFKIKDLEKKLIFFKERNHKKDNKTKLALNREKNNLISNLNAKKKSIIEDIIYKLESKIQAKEGLDSMLEEMPHIRNKTSYIIIKEVIKDSFNQYLSSNIKNTEHENLKDEITNKLIGENFKEKLYSTIEDKKYDSLIKDIKIKLIQKISNQVIKDSINNNIPDGIKRIFTKSLIEEARALFRQCLNGLPENKNLCVNQVTAFSTKKIYQEAIKEESLLFTKNKKSTFFDNLSQRLNKTVVHKTVKKNFGDMNNCHNQLDFNMDSLLYDDLSKGCTLISIQDFAIAMVTQFLNKYKRVISIREYKMINYRYKTCVEELNQYAINETAKHKKLTRQNTYNAFSKNPFLTSEWLQKGLNKCSNNFKTQIKSAVLSIF